MANLGMPGENTGFINENNSPTQHYGDTGLKPKRILRIFIILVVLLLGISVIIYWFAGGFDPTDIKYKSVTLEDVLNDLEVEGLLDNVTALHETFKDTNKFNLLYRKYKEIFNKTYPDAEDSNRTSIFKTNLLKVAEHNSKFKEYDTNYTMEVNLFTDMEYSEVVGKFGGCLQQEINHGAAIFERVKMRDRTYDKVPKTVDWTKFTTKVKHQGDCHSCALFATAACFELYYAYTQNKEPVDLSVEELLCCARKEVDEMYQGNHGCSGSDENSTAAFDYIIKYGLSLEKDYEYFGTKGNCKGEVTPQNCERDGKKHLKAEKLPGRENFRWFDYGTNEDYLKETIGLFGPTMVAIHFSPDMRFYGKKYNLDEGRANVYSTHCGTNVPNHVVLAVGYGWENGIDYWLLKNSLGSAWGDNGYFKIRRNVKLCAIATMVSTCFDDIIDVNKIKPYNPTKPDTIIPIHDT